MKSIQSKTQRALEQALDGASFHVPWSEASSAESWLALVGLRYGLFTCAAFHALLADAQSDDEIWVLDSLTEVAGPVAEHFTKHVLPHAPAGIDPSSAWRAGEMAQLVTDDYAPLFHRVPGLELALGLTTESFCEARMRSVLATYPVWQRLAAKKRFQGAVHASLRFAQSHYERRLLDLQEVPEIALLGE